MAELRITTMQGTDTVLTDTAIEAFRSSVRGELLRPVDAGYETARKVWNGMIDRRPALIIRCTGVADVIAAVQFARTHELLVAVRGGGHNVAGHAVCDGGLMIDLSRMKGLRIDPVRRTAHAQPGLTGGEFDRETQTFGLATPLGYISTTGIAGLTWGAAMAGSPARTAWRPITSSPSISSRRTDSSSPLAPPSTPTSSGACGAVAGTLAS